jgi:hypothetical protein
MSFYKVIMKPEAVILINSQGKTEDESKEYNGNASIWTESIDGTPEV